MDFTATEAQSELARLVGDIVAKLVTPQRQRELDAQALRGTETTTATARFDEPLWRALADAGVLSIDDGFGALEQSTVLAELGRALAAVPYLTSIVVSASGLAAFGHSDWAQRAARGEVILTAALVDDVEAPVTADGGVLTGTKLTVPYAAQAARLLVPAEGNVYLVDPADPGVRITPQQVVDFSPEATVELSGARGELVGGADLAEWLVCRATLGYAALQSGVLAQALDLAAAYGRERVQFERPIGSFQAVAQRLADAYIDVKGVRLSVQQAAWRLDAGLPADAEVATAKFWAADAGHRVAHTVIHVHGGVGLDTDHPVHRYFLAAKHHEFALGGATEHLRRLGALLADAPA